MNKDLKWLASNIQWPSEEVTDVGLDPDGEVRFNDIDYDFFPKIPPEGLTDTFGTQYTKDEFMEAKEKLKMTNITVFGQEEQSKSEKKPIEFVCRLDSRYEREDTNFVPAEWENLCLLGKDGEGYFDLIMAWDGENKDKTIYLGHWNDGIVA